MNRDEHEAAKYPKLLNNLDHLGGSDLTVFRDTVGAKQSSEDNKEVLEASNAKANRIRAMKTTTALKAKLDGIKKASNSAGSSVLETLLFLREEN